MCLSEQSLLKLNTIFKQTSYYPSQIHNTYIFCSKSIPHISYCFVYSSLSISRRYQNSNNRSGLPAQSFYKTFHIFDYAHGSHISHIACCYDFFSLNMLNPKQKISSRASRISPFPQYSLPIPKHTSPDKLCSSK